MRAHRLLLVLTVVLSALLLVSLWTTRYVYSFATQYYRDMNQVRLDPFDLKWNFSAPPSLAYGQQRVVFFGDSRVEQWPSPTSDHFQFVNRGISGETSTQVLGRFEAHVTPLRPDIIVLQVGVNDLKAIPVFPDQYTTITTTCLTNVRQIIVKATQLGATVILTTIFPVAEANFERRFFFWSDDVGNSIRFVNDDLRALSGEQVIVLDAYTLLVGEDGLTRSEYAADTLHLNASGYAVLNHALEMTLAGIEQGRHSLAPQKAI